MLVVGKEQLDGSGTSVQDINKFIKSFEMTQKMMKQLKNNKGGMKKLMNGIDTNTLKNFKFQRDLGTVLKIPVTRNFNNILENLLVIKLLLNFLIYKFLI